MARNFDGSADYISFSSGTGLSAYPFTVLAWAKPDVTFTTNNGEWVIFVEDDNSTTNFHALRADDGSSTTGCLQANLNGSGGGTAIVTTTNTFNANEWNSCVGIHAAANDHTSVLNGDWANRGTSTSNQGFPSTDQIQIGRQITADYWSGQIAMVAVVSVAATQAQVELFDRGVHPYRIFPGSMVHCWELFGRSGEPDIVPGGQDPGTINGTNVLDDRPPTKPWLPVSSLYFPTVAGASKTATGTLTLPIPTTVGVGTRKLTGTGSLSLPLPTTSGVGKFIRTATGSLTLTVPTTSGVGKFVRSATGTITLPVPSASGVGKFIRTGTGAWTLPIVNVAGVGLRKLTATGSMSLPVVTIAGVGVRKLTATGSISLPLPTTAGIGKFIRSATGSLTLPLPTIAGVGQLPLIGTGTLTLPSPTTSGVGKFIRTATGSFTLPLITAAGVGSFVRSATGSLTLPIPTIAGSGTVFVPAVKQGSGTLTLFLPSMLGSGTFLRSATGTLNLVVPEIAGLGIHLAPCTSRKFLVDIDMDGNNILNVGYVEITANAFASTDTLNLDHELALCDASGGSITINLPTASTATGKRYVLKKTDSSGNTVTVDPSGTETIDGTTTHTLSTQYETVHIVCDGTEWWTI